jgi:hypothetical protein
MERLEDLTEPQRRAILNILASRLDETLKDMGFELPLFAVVLFNDPKKCLYVANGSRPDLIRALRETADWLECEENVRRK